WQRFRKNGWPTSRQEAFHYTNLATLLENPSQGASLQHVPLPDLPTSPPAGVTVQPLAEALVAGDTTLQPLLEDRYNTLTSLNAALMSDGLVMDITRSSDTPILLLNDHP